ncbi:MULTISPECIES: hypothetical protein [Methylomicrobium]|uniref:Secreted protein n=1 Tax=Methylomicrobium album BG8 TaxID=686340 RepID=H8GNW5_METAL|nr:MULTISPECIES: hypothetical protein [Methylomicrobium]EIC28387.1 hypothetical protein Metal_0537 [Methylomicrobium album BG8]
MKKRTSFRLWKTLGFLVLALLADIAAAGIDKASVRNIEVTVDEQNLDQFGVSLSAEELARGVGKNLADAYFPVLKPGEKAFSHTLKAFLHPIKHQDTPVGFSFSAGNSDPRAQDFQKADVLTIECGLSDNRTPANTVSRTMEFGASSLKHAIGKKNRQQISKILVEQISTACYDLLEDLELDESAADTGKSAVKRPGWMPQIRVEIRNEEPASAENNAGKTASKPAKPAQHEEPKKKMIIHNQGSPVILKLGHERL